jgi:hypothetical protein
MVKLQLPDSLHKQLTLLAERDGIAIDQLLMLAAAEKVSALMTVEYLKERGKQGKREDFDALLAKVPSVEPEEYDRL